MKFKEGDVITTVDRFLGTMVLIVKGYRNKVVEGRGHAIRYSEYLLLFSGGNKDYHNTEFIDKSFFLAPKLIKILYGVE